MLRFRKTRPSDFPDIRRMNHDQFAFTQGELTIVDGVVYNDNNETIAFGIVKPFAEAIFITDESKSSYSRGKALNILMSVATAGTRNANLKQLHVFVEDKELAKGLIEHHEFKLCPEIVLVKNLL